MIMKILLVLLLLLGGCTIRRTPLDQQEVEKVVLRVRNAFDITEEEIDSWNRLYSEGMDNEYAQAIAVCFHHDYRKNISDNLRDFSRVMEGKTVEQCLLTAEKQYKYGLIRMRREQIIELREYYRCRNELLKYDNAKRIVPCEVENMVLKKEEPEAQEIWEKYRNIGGGNGFYEVNINRYWQCTTFVWGRFFEVYGYDSGAVGDGCFHATETVRAHGSRFTISTTPQPGAVFSMWISDYSHAGHTGFIEAVDGDYIWFSDANYDGKGTIRFNYRMKLADFARAYPGTFYAVPIRF